MSDYLDDPQAQANLPVPAVSTGAAATDAKRTAAGHPPVVSAADLGATHFDIAIVGAGPVGASLAYALGRSGRRVAVVERDWTEPDRIVGELLQPGGVRALACLDLLDTLDGIDAVPVTGYTVFTNSEQSVTIPYPTADAVAHLKPHARGLVGPTGRLEGRAFHHGHFVQKLRARALAQPNVTCIEATVRDLEEDMAFGHVTGLNAVRKTTNHAGTASESEELHIRADVTIVADGIFSKFRGGYGSSLKPELRSHFVGLELDHAPMPAPHHGHVVLAPSGPVLLYQIAERPAPVPQASTEAPQADHDTPKEAASVHTTRILIDLPGAQPPTASKGDLRAFIRRDVAPFLPAGLDRALLRELDLIESGRSSQRLRSMSNSWLPPSVQGQSRFRRGCIVVGDAMNMRHPLTGGGMTVAFWDVVHLANMLHGDAWWPGCGTQKERMSGTLNLRSWDPQIRPALLTWHWARKDLAGVINVLALALYSLFGAADENLRILREGCFAYFQRGPSGTDGPVRLLSGTTPSPALLIWHFTCVALYSVVGLFVRPRAHVQATQPPAAGAGAGARANSSGGKDVHVITRRATLSEYPLLVVRSVCVLYTAAAVFIPILLSELRMNRPDFSHVPRKSGGFIPKDATPFGSFSRFLVLVCLGIITVAWTVANPARHPHAFASPTLNLDLGLNRTLANTA